MATLIIQYDGKTIIQDSDVNCDVSLAYDTHSIDKKKKIIEFRQSKFYLPNYKEDLIQEVISHCSYFETVFLEITRKYLSKNPVIVDVGANIGNHTLFWANECDAKKIYAFEPVPLTFKILKKNIKINNLQERVKLYNIGLSDENTNAEIISFDPENMGGTRLRKAEDSTKGDIPLRMLDSLKIKEEKIDLIKIDVEGMDYRVLTGAIETIKKYKPVIMVESFDEEYNISSRILKALGYKQEQNLGSFEYIFVYDKKRNRNV